MTRYTTLELSKDGPVGELRLSRPDVQNRFDHELFAEIVPALDELRTDQEIRAVVLSSTGKTFSAGGDLQSILEANADLQVLLGQIDEGRQVFRAFADFPKPLVIALHGHTFGVSTSIALTGDAVVSTAGVRISDPHVHLGLVAGDGGVVTWPTHLPLVRAKRHLLWGEPLLAEDAHALGLVTELVSSGEEVRTTALELAGRVATLPPVAVQLTKRALNKVLGSRVDEAFDTAFYLEAISASTHDLREAVGAFKDNRAGVWSGR